ncbi:dihydrofolate reductase [Puniceicoccus vermicola]|uniref:Dihydrofolate reductase n=2 Tax=Puniceicoccus vermicola TaxID=388746 RepID=A0A7X1E5V7_9BACT|nr:dihydrofolate reductase [Puniceicoccus vermicola]MBC2603468.1 dihydrofolate reductase [Puniceicoccus vermicola]
METSSQPKSEESSHSWIAVAAMADNRVIGRDGQLPWHLPGDLKFFKNLTSGATILMGRKTYESIGRPLPKRRNLVLSRSDFEAPGIEVFSSVKALQSALAPDEKVYVIGGAEIYRLTMDLWTEVYLTRVKLASEGDTFFPPFEERFAAPETVHEEDDFAVEHFARR